LKKFYYSDGRSFNSPESPLGLVAILQEDEAGRWVITSGGDFYVKRDGFWLEVDIFGLIDFCLETGLVLEGRMVSNSRFQEVMTQALEDRKGLQNG